jgi:hypothetical protein
MATLGGILLIIGAFFTFKGNIFRAVIIYGLADLCWVSLSIIAGDYVGASFIIIGMLLGLFAFYKMKTGKMRKDLNIQ